MKVVAWNLGHRICEKPIPDELIAVLADIDADIVLLNEFVDGPTRGSFRESMAAAGYVHQRISRTPGRHNQVFAASRHPIVEGDIAPPTLDGPASANFLHIRFHHTSIELVGLRVPAYVRAVERNAYWSELSTIMSEVRDRAIAFAGDINIDPFRKAPPDTAEVAAPGVDGYRIPNPAGDWSYINIRGTSTSRIDHVMHTSSLRVEVPTYVATLNGHRLAAPLASQPISDHAALTFTLDIACV